MSEQGYDGPPIHEPTDPRGLGETLSVPSGDSDGEAGVFGGLMAWCASSGTLLRFGSSAVARAQLAAELALAADRDRAVSL